MLKLLQLMFYENLCTVFNSGIFQLLFAETSATQKHCAVNTSIIVRPVVVNRKLRKGECMRCITCHLIKSANFTRDYI